MAVRAQSPKEMLQIRKIYVTVFVRITLCSQRNTEDGIIHLGQTLRGGTGEFYTSSVNITIKQ